MFKLNIFFFFREGRLHRRTHVVIPRELNVGVTSMIPFSVLGPSRGNRQADLWEAMMNVNSGNRIRSLRYLSGKYYVLLNILCSVLAYYCLIYLSWLIVQYTLLKMYITLGVTHEN